jgi:hypothetical protein
MPLKVEATFRSCSLKFPLEIYPISVASSYYMTHNYVGLFICIGIYTDVFTRFWGLRGVWEYSHCSGCYAV